MNENFTTRVSNESIKVREKFPRASSTSPRDISMLRYRPLQESGISSSAG